MPDGQQCEGETNPGPADSSTVSPCSDNSAATGRSGRTVFRVDDEKVSGRAGLLGRTEAERTTRASERTPPDKKSRTSRRRVFRRVHAASLSGLLAAKRPGAVPPRYALTFSAIAICSPWTRFALAGRRAAVPPKCVGRNAGPNSVRLLLCQLQPDSQGDTRPRRSVASGLGRWVGRSAG